MHKERQLIKRSSNKRFIRICNNLYLERRKKGWVGNEKSVKVYDNHLKSKFFWFNSFLYGRDFFLSNDQQNDKEWWINTHL